jgi:hypothetical protein
VNTVITHNWEVPRTLCNLSILSQHSGQRLQLLVCKSDPDAGPAIMHIQSWRPAYHYFQLDWISRNKSRNQLGDQGSRQN